VMRRTSVPFSLFWISFFLIGLKLEVGAWWCADEGVGLARVGSWSRFCVSCSERPLTDD
jgi:hypothetical protein